VCWDVLYVGDTSVTARPLTERQALLRSVVREAPEAGVPIGEHAWYIGFRACLGLHKFA
jgi:ATP-dependent DNA ligase